MKQNLFLLKSIAGIVLAGFFILILFLDSRTIRKSPDEYVKVHHIGESYSSWRTASVDNYVTWNCILIAIAAFYIVANAVYLIRQYRALIISILIFETIILILVVWNFVQWANTGFDH